MHLVNLTKMTAPSGSSFSSRSSWPGCRWPGRRAQDVVRPPWHRLARLTLDPSVVYEAWCSQHPGGIIVMIEDVHGKPEKAGEAFSAAHIVGDFDPIEEMHRVYDRYPSHTGVTADASGWRLAR